MFTPKGTIDEYIDNSELNSRIYDVLLYLNDCETCEQNHLKREPLEIFNVAYAICDELQLEKHPEVATVDIWEQLRNRFLLCETNIIFSCVYVILFFSNTENPNIKFFLHRIKNRIDKGYFKEFEPLISEELTYLTTLTDNFEALQNKADQIEDLDQRDLFLADYGTRYKQSKHKGDILQQISDERELIHTIKEVLGEEDNAPDVASIKVRAAVIMEMLKTMGLGKARNDLTKISKLIAFLTGNSYHKIYNEIQKGISFTKKHHSKHLNEINKIFAEINASISIDIDKHY